MARYAKEHGSWYLHDENGIVGRHRINLMTDTVSVLFDPGIGLIAHGDTTSVLQKMEKAKASGLYPDPVIVTSAEWTEETLNKILANSAYVCGWWREANGGSTFQKSGALPPNEHPR